MRCTRILSAALVLGGCAAALGCAGAADEGDDRAAWLRAAIWEDNRRVIERDPEAGRLGLKKIAADPYTYLRGTAQIFALDATTPGQPGFVPTGYGSAAAARVRVVGDPHFENIGVYRTPEGTLLVAYNDFDGATFGPYWLDVRRLALSFAVMAQMGQGQGFAAGDVEALARAVADGYAAEIAAMAAGAPPARLHEGESQNPIWVDLLRKADEDGAAREELDEYTTIGDDGVRRMFYGVVEPRLDPELAEDEVVPVSDEEERLIRALMAAYPGTVHDPARFPPGSFAVKGISRRLGAGVKSFPLLRYYVLIEGPSASQDDDWIVELKETGDALRYPGWERVFERVYRNNGERVVEMQRRLQETPEADALLGWAEAPPMVFKAKERSKVQRGLDIYRVLPRIAEGTWTAADLIDVARTSGRLLAAAHARAEGPGGERGLDAIAPALSGDAVGFADETAAFVAGYLPQLIEDHATLVRLLQREPLLGAP